MAFAVFTEIFVLALALMYTRTAAAPSKLESNLDPDCVGPEWLSEL